MIVAGYHYWGEQVLTRLRGMFAFVIWDRQERRAFGARDYFGIKPLHYLETADGLYLASEKKALLPFAHVRLRRATPASTPANLSHYLTLQYVPEPGTLHQGISRIGSGEYLTWTPGGRIDVRRWYRPVFRPAPVDDEQRLYHEIRETLRESVRMHMRSDVPVGSFLSSGIDSTAVVALAREFNPNILTFTVGYDVPGYSEIDVAQDSARHLDVTTIPTKIGPQDMIDALPKIVWHLDDPVADPALVPLYFVAKKAAEHVTVVLSGEGADEFFGGYTIYREPLSLGTVNGLPGGMQKGLRAVSKAIPQGVKGKSFLERGTTPIEQRYYGNARMFTEEEKQHLLRRYDPSVRYTDVTAPDLRRVHRARRRHQDAVRRPLHLAARRHPGQGRPDLDGALAGGAGAVPGPGGLRRGGDHPGGPEAAAALRRHQVRDAPGVAGRGAAGHRQPQEARLPDPDAGLAARRDVRVGPAHPVHLRRRRPARPVVRDAAARGAQAGGGRPLPQGVDGADLLHLARDLRGPDPRPGHPAQPVGPAHQAGGRLHGPLTAVSSDRR